jgi:hypothetical protein
MNAGRLSVAFVMLTWAFAVDALARGPDPAVEPDASYDDDTEPSVVMLPSDLAPPPTQTMPVAPPPPAAAPAAAGPGFGFAGQVAISDDLQLGATQVSYDVQGQSTKRTQFQIRPAVDIFPIANLSLGGQLIIGYTALGGSGGSASQSELGALARVGYVFAISPTTSIWPRVAVGYDRPGGQTTVVPGVTQENVAVQVYLPVIFRPVRNFFIGGGPIVSTQVVSKVNGADVPKATTVGLQSTLGGCFRAM